MQPIKIRVITPVLATGTPADKKETDRLISLAGPNAEVSNVYIRDGPQSIESEYEDALAVPATVEEARRAEREGADAIVLNCTADTGLKPCREVVSIPVVAPSLASMHLAAQLAHRFSVLTFLDRVNERFENMAWRWGLAHKLASVRSVRIPVLALGEDEERLAEMLFEVGRRCYEEDGAHALILGCTDFEEVSGPLRQRFVASDIPMLLLEPYLVSLRQAEALVSMQLSHSKLTYPDPKS